MCQHTSRTEQTLLELSLDVQLHSKKRAMNGTSTPTLAKCLQSWVSPEELIMEGYQCQGCHGYPDKLTKQLRIKRLPAMLCMQMKVYFYPNIYIYPCPTMLTYSSASSKRSQKRARCREKSTFRWKSTCSRTP
jgi:ubiquitin C-terminal hydrolase